MEHLVTILTSADAYTVLRGAESRLARSRNRLLHALDGLAVPVRPDNLHVLGTSFRTNIAREMHGAKLDHGMDQDPIAWITRSHHLLQGCTQDMFPTELHPNRPICRLLL